VNGRDVLLPVAATYSRCQSVLDVGYCYRCLEVVSSVCELVTTVSHAKTAEPIKMLFMVQARIGPRNHVLDSGTYRRHLANMIEQSKTRAMWAVYNCSRLFWASNFCPLPQFPKHISGHNAIRY